MAGVRPDRCFFCNVPFTDIPASVWAHGTCEDCAVEIDEGRAAYQENRLEDGADEDDTV